MSGVGIDHVTVEPPTQEEQERTRADTALELLRCLDEDWEYLDDHEKRREVKNVKRVLNNE